MKYLIASLSAFAIALAAVPAWANHQAGHNSPTVEKTKKKTKRAANKTKRKARNAADRADRAAGRL
jgi:hypothetical protein